MWELRQEGCTMRVSFSPSYRPPRERLVESGRPDRVLGTWQFVYGCFRAIPGQRHRDQRPGRGVGVVRPRPLP
jgi:hypothetical protein